MRAEKARYLLNACIDSLSVGTSEAMRQTSIARGVALLFMAGPETMYELFRIAEENDASYEEALAIARQSIEVLSDGLALIKEQAA